MSSGGRFPKSAGDPREELDWTAIDGVFADDNQEQNPIPDWCFFWRDTMVSPYQKCTSWMDSVRGASAQCTLRDSSRSTRRRFGAGSARVGRVVARRRRGVPDPVIADSPWEEQIGAVKGGFRACLIPDLHGGLDRCHAGAQGRAAGGTGPTKDETAGATERDGGRARHRVLV